MGREPEQADSAPAFIPGLALSERFFAEAVRPLLDRAYPDLRYSAALIGPGSEVLGYDTPRSTDHNWGPRLLLFLDDADHVALAASIDALLKAELPATFHGYSTHFGPPGPDGARGLAPSNGGPIGHKIEIHALRHWLTSQLGVDPSGALSAIDWLLIPQQVLLEVTMGRVFHDDLGLLEPARTNLAWYPLDVWRYLLAAQWGRISQQEAFVGRTGEVGDDLGSALVAADLVRDLMRLAFLIERRYAPYSKWFGTAFARLDNAPRLTPLLAGALAARTWQEREAHLVPAYETVAGMHNALGIAPPVDPRTRPFHGRPFRVLHAERFRDATASAITNPAVRAIIDRAGLIGGIDQISDNVDLKGDAALRSRLRALFA